MNTVMMSYRMIRRIVVSIACAAIILPASAVLATPNILQHTVSVSRSWPISATLVTSHMHPMPVAPSSPTALSSPTAFPTPGASSIPTVYPIPSALELRPSGGGRATSPTPAASSASWSSPVSIDPTGNGITSVSCPVATFCMAVDNDGNALTYNGSGWSPPLLVASSGVHLYSVSCASPSFCMAAGSGGYALSYNGSTWSTPSQVDANSGSFGITSVSCPSASFCMAVDGNGNALYWNGTSWSQPVTIDPGSGGMSVSCPTTTFCMAVDDNGDALTYVAGTWGIPDTILSGQILSSIACTSPGFCMAVSYFGEALAFNGVSWSAPTEVDSTGYNLSVSCRPSYSCVALSSSGNAVLYNGTSWSSPVSMDSSSPTSLSCGSTQSCVAVDAAGDAIYYSAPAPPVLDHISPSSGSISGGTTVNIYGSGFSSIEGVKFGSYSASSFKVVSQDLIEATSPGIASPQNVAVSVSNTNATSSPQMTCRDSFSYGIAPPSVPQGNYVPISPVRIADTRPSSGKPYSGDTLSPCGTLNIQVTGIDGIPSSQVAAIAANVTVVSPNSSGYLSIYPANAIRGTFSNVNFTAGQIIANLVEVPLNPSTGQITIYNGSNGAANVVVDVEGYVPSSSSSSSGYLYNPISPLRICDTRTGNPSGLSGIEAQCNSKEPQGGSSFSIDVAGIANIASNATAVALSLTAVQPQSGGFLSLYPSGSFPGTSNLNFVAGVTIANFVVVPLSSSGKIEIYTSATTNILVDVSGYYSSTGSMLEVASPVRICDTRPSSGEPYAGDTLGSSSVLQLKVGGVGGVPDTATAVVINVTVTNTTANSYLTVYPAGAAQPVASSLNWRPGSTIADLVVVKVGTSGTIDIYNFAGSTDVIVDVEGWY